MQISIIGDGNVGTALQRGLTAAGHQVAVTGNDPERVRTLASEGEVVFLAVPFAAHDEVAVTIADRANGKPVIDVSNALSPDYSLALGFTTSAAEELQKKLPEARVVKAFNTSFAAFMDSGRLKGEQLTAFVAGDHASAKDIVRDIARSLGFDAVDAGPLANARLLEPVGILNIQLGYMLGLGPDMGIRIVR